MDQLITQSKLSALHSLEHLFLSEKLEETGTAKLVILSILIISLILIMLTAWSAMTNIDEIASVNGTVIPSDPIYSIQHSDGGAIFKLYKKDGEFVKSQELILELSPETLKTDLQRFKNHCNVLEIDILRLQSNISKQPLTKKLVKDNISYPEAISSSSLALLINNSLLLHKHQIDTIKNDQYNIELLIQNEETNLSDIEMQIRHLQRREEILRDQTNMYQQLMGTQAASKLNLLNTQDRLQDITTELLEVTREKTAIESKVLGLKSKIFNEQMKKTENSLQELSDLTAEHVEIKKQITKINEKIAKLQINAPISGLIKGLELKAGNVIKPAEIIMEIVPISEQMMIEARIPPREIGHIKVNDKAKIKVSSYDFTLYGHVEGYVHKVSPSTFLNKENEPYYKAVIVLDKNHLGDNPKANLIIPGMTVIVDIQTGQKSLLKYFIKPITRAWTGAFHEK